MLLKAWQANIDLQPVYNYYMTAYLSKSENSASEAMKQVIGLFICSRQVSVEEAVCLCLPELWLRKCQPGVMFLNTNLSHERISLLRSEKELLEMPEESKDI